jgi:hypothetical protein
MAGDLPVALPYTVPGRGRLFSVSNGCSFFLVCNASVGVAGAKGCLCRRCCPSAPLPSPLRAT